MTIDREALTAVTFHGPSTLDDAVQEPEKSATCMVANIRSQGRYLDILPPETAQETDPAGVIRTTDVHEALKNGARAVLHPLASTGMVLAAEEAIANGLLVIDPALLEILLSPRKRERPESDGLSPRENTVLQLIADGQSNKQIASTLGISENTVKFHSNSLMKKLGVQSRTEAVVRAARLGVLVL